MKILILEDDLHIAEGLEYSLTSEGYEVIVCPAVSKAKKAIETDSFDLAILDINLPDGSGYEVCKLIKTTGDIPVIFLTAYDDEVNVVMGLDIGADDYISKPFRIKELLSRIRSVLRRYSVNKTPQTYEHKDIKINIASAKVYKNGQEIYFTALEYKLLLTLFNNYGQVLSRNQLLSEIWDIAGDFVNDNTLTVYMKRLREKIENNPQNPEIIKTVRGLGYRVGD